MKNRLGDDMPMFARWTLGRMVVRIIFTENTLLTRTANRSPSKRSAECIWISCRTIFPASNRPRAGHHLEKTDMCLWLGLDIDRHDGDPPELQDTNWRLIMHLGNRLDSWASLLVAFIATDRAETTSFVFFKDLTPAAPGPGI